MRPFQCILNPILNDHIFFEDQIMLLWPEALLACLTSKLVVISGRHIVAQSGTTIFLVCVAILKGIISSTLQQSNIISSHTSITGLALCTRLGGKMEYYIESHKIYCILIHTILSNDAEETLSLILSIDYFTKNLVPLQLHFPLAAPVYTTPLTLICCCYRKLLLLQSTKYTIHRHMAYWNQNGFVSIQSQIFFSNKFFN